MASFQNQKIFIPKPPDRGSFPLDHESMCRGSMLHYMQCLVDNDRDSKKCRTEAKEYLACRMDNNLMAREEWNYLGFNERRDQPKSEKKD